MKLASFFVLLFLGIVLIHAQDDEENDVSIVDAAFGEGEGDGSYEGSDESNGSIECGEYEVYSRCDGNPACQRTCETLGLDGIPCPRTLDTKSCIEGCICQENYVRSSYRGQCMHNNRCPRVKH